jgi:nucleoside-diphosphate-sugar epimerase
MAKIIVTGTTGFIGYSIYRKLQTYHDVIALPGRLNEIKPGSIETDLIIHCAGALRNRPTEFYSSNELGTQFLLNGLSKKTKIIYLSSRGVYKNSTSDLTETSMVGPDDDYGKTKLAGERLIQESGNPYLILRLTATYGYNGKRLGPTFIDSMIKHMVEQKPIQLFTPDRNHDYLFVEDVSTWIQSLIPEGNHWNEIFNFAGKSGSLHDFIRLASRIVKKKYNTKVNLIEIDGPPPKAPIVNTQKLFRFFPDLKYTSAESAFETMLQGHSRITSNSKN